MSGTVNKHILIGNLGRPPEDRQTQSGKRVVSFSIATSKTWRDKSSGERKEKTSWHKIVIFDDRLCEVAANMLGKGSKVYIEGEVETRTYEKDGQTHYITETVLHQFVGKLTVIDGKGRDSDDGEGSGPSWDGDGGGSSSSESSTSGGGDLDDEIPF